MYNLDIQHKVGTLMKEIHSGDIYEIVKINLEISKSEISDMDKFELTLVGVNIKDLENPAAQEKELGKDSLVELATLEEIEEYLQDSDIELEVVVIDNHLQNEILEPTDLLEIKSSNNKLPQEDNDFKFTEKEVDKISNKEVDKISNKEVKVKDKGIEVMSDNDPFKFLEVANARNYIDTLLDKVISLKKEIAENGDSSGKIKRKINKLNKEIKEISLEIK